VAFVRQGVSEELIYQAYLEFVLIPHITRIREQLGFVRDAANNEIPDDMLAVSWSDGGQAQLKNTINSKTALIFKENKIVSNKHAAATSGVQQPCDLASTHKSQRALIQSFMASDFMTMNNEIGLRWIDEAFELAWSEHGLELGGNKRSLMREFLICLPEVMVRAFAKASVMKGFVLSGMLDEEQKRWPDFNAILGTSSRELTMDEYDLIERTFPALHAIQKRKGQIEESDFDEHGFPQDVCSSGTTPVNRDCTCERFQRAKTLNHEWQVELRNSRIRKVQEKRDDAERKGNAAIAGYLDKNEECEALLKRKYESHKVAARPEGVEPLEAIETADVMTITTAELEECTLPMFKDRKVIIPFLKAFCIVRKYDIASFPHRGI